MNTMDGQPGPSWPVYIMLRTGGTVVWFGWTVKSKWFNKQLRNGRF